MKVFIWERIAQATSNWHPEGGVMVIAETKERAVELAGQEGSTITETDEYTEYELVCDHEEKVIIFPDSGCC